MIKYRLFTFSVELFWILVAVAFAFIVAYPLMGFINQHFLALNIFMATLAATYFRWTIYYKNIPFLKFTAVQVPLFVFNSILFFVVLDKINEMIFMMDTYDLNLFLTANQEKKGLEINALFYLYKKEFLFFSVGLMILTITIQLRLLQSFFERIRKMK